MVATNDEQPNFPDMEIESLGSLADLSNSVCRGIFSYWHDLKIAGAFDTFDLISVPQAIPHLVMLDLVGAEPTFKFRMTGQSIVEVSGQDLTGEIMSKTGTEAPLTHKFCAAVLQGGRAVVSHDAFTVKRANRLIHIEESIGLPLFNAQDAVDRIIVVHGPK